MTACTAIKPIAQTQAFVCTPAAAQVDNLTDFSGDLTFDKALVLISGKPSLVSYNPQAKASDMDNMRYRGYAERYAALPTGECVRQLLTKSFGEPAWINLPAGASVKYTQ